MYFMSVAPFGFTHIFVHSLGSRSRRRVFDMPDYNSFYENRSIGIVDFAFLGSTLRQRWKDADKFKWWRKGGKNLVGLWRGFWPYIPSDLRHSSINPSGISVYSQRA